MSRVYETLGYRNQPQTIKTIGRLSEKLYRATLKSATGPAYTNRFNTMFQMENIQGAVAWGSYSQFIHNELQLQSLQINTQALYREGIHSADVPWNDWSKYRLFRYPAETHNQRLVGFEEWLNADSKESHRFLYVVFDAQTGEEWPHEKTEHIRGIVELEEFLNGQ